MSAHDHHHGHHHHHHGHGHAHEATNSTYPPTTGSNHEGMFHDTGHSGQHMLFFHLNNKIVVLFQEWEIRSIAVLIGSCVAIFVLTILYEGLKQCRERHARRYTRTRPQEEHQEIADPEKAVTSNGSAFAMEDTDIRPTRQLRIFTCFHVVQTLMHVLQTVIHFLLMLVVMTYNVWLCIAVVAGAGLGYYIMAGLLAERVPRPRARTKKSGSIFALKRRTRADAQNTDQEEETGNQSTDDGREKTDGKDDNQNKAGEEGQTGNGSAVVDITGNGSAVVENTGNESAVVDSNGSVDTDGENAEEAKEPETKGEDQNVEVSFGEENDNSGKENPAFEADHLAIPPADTSTTE